MLLVIARKFNDIYYSMSLPQWNEAETRHLVIISNGIPKESFPNQDKFDKVTFFRYDGESFKNILSILKQLAFTDIPKSDVLVLSNPVLVTNQFIIKHSSPEKLIFIEDGSMNYSAFTPSKSKLKKTLQFLLGIRESKIFDSINYTFLFYPEKATFYFGNPLKLNLRTDIFPIQTDTSFIEGKKVFVGQPLYDYGYLSIERYNEVVNKLIKEFNIDYYIPHAFSSQHESINADILDLNRLNTTLEAIASKRTFQLFSLGSTVLYTCKTINPHIKSFLLAIPDESMLKLDTRFVRTFCNQILSIE